MVVAGIKNPETNKVEWKKVFAIIITFSFLSLTIPHIQHVVNQYESNEFLSWAYAVGIEVGISAMAYYMADPDTKKFVRVVFGFVLSVFIIYSYIFNLRYYLLNGGDVLFSAFLAAVLPIAVAAFGLSTIGLSGGIEEKKKKDNVNAAKAEEEIQSRILSAIEENNIEWQKEVTKLNNDINILLNNIRNLTENNQTLERTIEEKVAEIERLQLRDAEKNDKLYNAQREAQDKFNENLTLKALIEEQRAYINGESSSAPVPSNSSANPNQAEIDRLREEWKENPTVDKLARAYELGANPNTLKQSWVVKIAGRKWSEYSKQFREMTGVINDEQ